MRNQQLMFTFAAFGSLAVAPLPHAYEEFPALVIDGRRTANLQPVGTYATAASTLRFEPRVDLQSRNMAEAQGDVAIRGGIFENTGFLIGSATLLDPQTGHYFAEIPVPPSMLEDPEVLTGVDNALRGFNSTVGSIAYGWAPILPGGEITAGAGDHDYNFQSGRVAETGAVSGAEGWMWGVEAEAARSESDGTIANGGHDFNRLSGRVQLRGPRSQTDLFAGYQSKNFSWPNMYTPPSGVFVGAVEFERLKTRLFALNHHQRYAADSFLEATLFHRRHTDDYLLDAQTFDFPIAHETKATALGVSGRHAFGEQWGLRYAAQVTGDSIDSTSLEQGDFTSRSYYSFSLLPEYRIRLNAQETLLIRAGTAYDDTNRDDSEFSPMAEIRWTRRGKAAGTESVYLSYAETTQVAGYTAIGGSETSGVFQSNHDLGRETARNFEFGFSMERAAWAFEGAVFHRVDENLVDWVFRGDPFARSAENVDLTTTGFEAIATRHWDTVDAIVSYTYLEKDEDFGDPSIVGSFYALNYPEHRATAGIIWRPLDALEIRIDNEWRKQRANSLRQGDDHAFFTHAGVSYFPPQFEGLEIFAAVDNAWDDRFQEIPGVPGSGDQYSGGVTWRW